ncbi:MAG: ADP-ribosylglycohydrolase family protein [Erysipelotrichaceae bacterium]|nr:ADP-ribosylglycohydrolase family protein [Erysipelotrichaceae bacterium]
MWGAIIGDVVGSLFERFNHKSKDFELFHALSHYTDDTVMTIATMDALLRNIPFEVAYKEWYRKYPKAGYGQRFREWGKDDSYEPLRSYGNGSAMRVSPVAYWKDSFEEIMEIAKCSTNVTHNHPEGVKGAQAVASAIFLARTNKSKEEIKKFIEETFDYDLSEPTDSIRKWYKFDVTCQGSVPQAIRCFYEATDFEDAIRLAISIGGDSDTIGCMTGSMAEAYYPIEGKIKQETLNRLPREFVYVFQSFLQKTGKMTDDEKLIFSNYQPPKYKNVQ